MVDEPLYRVRYWRWVNTEFGEWVQTGLMSKRSAELLAENLQCHERVEIYKDEQEAQ